MNEFCGCNSLAQSRAYSSSLLPVYPLAVSLHILSSRSLLRLLFTFHSLLSWRSSRATPPRTLLFHKIHWPMPVFVPNHVLSLISSGFPPILVPNGPNAGLHSPGSHTHNAIICLRMSPLQTRRLTPIFFRDSAISMTLRRPHILLLTCFSIILFGCDSLAQTRACSSSSLYHFILSLSSYPFVPSSFEASF
jgi:hypothetical protein